MLPIVRDITPFLRPRQVFVIISLILLLAGITEYFTYTKANKPQNSPDQPSYAPANRVGYYIVELEYAKFKDILHRFDNDRRGSTGQDTYNRVSEFLKSPRKKDSHRDEHDYIFNKHGSPESCFPPG